MKILNRNKIAFVKNLEKSFKGQGVYQDNYLNRKLGRVGQPYKKEEPKSRIPGSTDEIEKLNAKGVQTAIYNLNNIGTNVKDKGDYFQIDFDHNDFTTHGETSPKITQIKKYLEGMGASCVISKNQIKAYKNIKKKEAHLDNVKNKEKEIHDENIKDLVKNTTTLKEAKGARLDAIISYSNSDGIEGIKVKEGASDEEKRIAIADFYADSADFNSDYLDEIVEDALADYVPKKDNKDD